MQRAGGLVTRRELLADVWGYSDDVSSRTADTHVAVLRRIRGIGRRRPGSSDGREGEVSAAGLSGSGLYFQALILKRSEGRPSVGPLYAIVKRSRIMPVVPGPRNGESPCVQGRCNADGDSLC